MALAESQEHTGQERPGLGKDCGPGNWGCLLCKGRTSQGGSAASPGVQLCGCETWGVNPDRRVGRTGLGIQLWTCK